MNQKLSKVMPLKGLHSCLGHLSNAIPPTPKVAAKDPNVPTNFDSLPVSFLKKLKIVCGPARSLTHC
jgi:hypothetical protein